MTLTYIHCLDLPPGFPTDGRPASACTPLMTGCSLLPRLIAAQRNKSIVSFHIFHIIVLYSCMEAGSLSLVKICIKGSGSTEEDAVTLE